MRTTPSRNRRNGSDAGSFLARQNQSISNAGKVEQGLTPADEAVWIFFRELKEAGDQKIARICARPLVGRLNPIAEKRLKRPEYSILPSGFPRFRY